MVKSPSPKQVMVRRPKPRTTARNSMPEMGDPANICCIVSPINSTLINSRAARPDPHWLIDEPQAEEALGRCDRVVGEGEGGAGAGHRTARRRPGRIRQVGLVFELILLARHPRPVQNQVGG